METYYTAFLDLTSCRAQGYTEGPISWLSIADYADRNGYDGEQREDLLYFVTVLDAVYLEHKAGQLMKKTKQPSSSKKKMSAK